MLRWIVPALTISGLLGPSAAWACKNDAECKGQRMCVGGKCVSPEDSPSPAAANSAPEKTAVKQAPGHRRARDKTWSLSFAVNSVLAWRDAGYAVGDGFHLGLGGWIAWEPRSVPLIVAAEFVYNGWDADRLNGGMIGVGPVWHLADRVPVDFILLASLAFRGTTRWGGPQVWINGVLQTDDPQAERWQTDQLDVFVLSPYVRIGHTLFVQLGPQLGLGLQTRNRFLGDFAYENLQSKTTTVVPSIQGAMQIGYRF